MATYQESENIERLVGEILASAPGAHVLVVDDNSPDGTGAIVKRISASDRRVDVLERPGKMGLGTAYFAGFRTALDASYTHVLTMDADFSHNPQALPAILARADEAGVDMVVGSRYVRGGGIIGWPVHRRVLSWGANVFARAVLGLRAHDCTGGYRCYSRRVVAELEKAPVTAHGYSALIEILWQCQANGYRLEEVPITFVDRQLGQSKISRREIFRGLTSVVKLRFRPRRRVIS